MIAKKIPKNEKNNGIFFISKGKNSISIKVLYKIDLYIELPQNIFPKPINKSFNRKPENRLPIDKPSKAIAMFLGSSWIC
jgi:hypothetical protein